MIEVFKTNVQHLSEAKQVVNVLLQHFPDSKINFDLDDCDKILRVEGKNFLTEKVRLLVEEHGFYCNVLE